MKRPTWTQYLEARNAYRRVALAEASERLAFYLGSKGEDSELSAILEIIREGYDCDRLQENTDADNTTGK